MRRVVVVGCSGSGKTTVALALSKRLGLPHLEMDAVAHRGGFATERPSWFASEIEQFALGDRWVMDGGYTGWGSRDLIWPRADTFVWLDLPKRTVMSRVIRRTVKRVVTREELWDGVKEPWSNFYSLDEEKNLIVWTWNRFDHTRAKYESSTRAEWAHATVCRLRSQAEVDIFLQALNRSDD